jgi:hypothetical protein
MSGNEVLKIIGFILLFGVFLGGTSIILMEKNISEQNVFQKAQNTCAPYALIHQFEDRSINLVVCNTEKGLVVRESK